MWLQKCRVQRREHKWLLVRNELLYQQGSSIKSAPHISFWSRRLTKNGPKWRLNVRNMWDGEAASKKWWFSYSKCNDEQWKRERDAFTAACSFCVFMCPTFSCIVCFVSLCIWIPIRLALFCLTFEENIHGWKTISTLQYAQLNNDIMLHHRRLPIVWKQLPILL